MEAIVKAKQIGGSIAVIIPNKIIKTEMIHPDDTLKVTIEKKHDMSFLWGKGKNIKKPTEIIMREIDEGEEW